MAQSIRNANPQNSNAQRIRGPHLRTLITKAEGVPYKEALKRANGENLVLASNKRLAQSLEASKNTIGITDWRCIEEAFPCWTGTMAAYVESNKSFRRSSHYSKNNKAILYKDPKDGQLYLFPVPDKYDDGENMILAAEHPDLALVPDGKSLVVSALEVSIVIRFPKLDGYSMVDGRFGLPNRSVDNPDAAYFWRTESRVGPVARYTRLSDGCGGKKTIDLVSRPSERFGAVVESV